jgi:hypothetical protein
MRYMVVLYTVDGADNQCERAKTLEAAKRVVDESDTVWERCIILDLATRQIVHYYDDETGWHVPISEEDDY